MMNKTKEMTLIALFVVVYIIGSKITLPLGIIPFTLQTCVVFLAGCLLTPRQIVISNALFIGLGLIGLPVFAGGGGLAYLLKPSCGFLFAFPIAGAFIAWAKQKWQLYKIYQLFPICMMGLFIIYSIGASYMFMIMRYYVGTTMDLQAVLSVGILPFVISDSVSCFLTCTCAVRLYPALRSFSMRKTINHEL